MRTRRSGNERRSTAIWLAMWVVICLAIGLAAAALIAWTLLDLMGSERSMVASEVRGESLRAEAIVADTIPGGLPAVNEYLLYVALHEGASDANRYHDYTADGLRRLAAALSALLQFDPGTAASQRMQIVALYRRAEDLQRDPTSATHADVARDAFTTAAVLSGWIQERDAPTAAEEVKALRDAASDLEPNIPLLQQTTAVERCFDRAAAVVRALATRRVTDQGRTT